MAILNNKIVHYLHGAIDYEHRKSLPNDLLIYNAILWAKENNAIAFNLMSSPRKQLSLIKYKEKWGGKTSPNITYELGTSSIMYSVFKLINAVYNRIN